MAPPTEELVSGVVPLVDLPLEVFIQIVDRLPIQAISRLASTCKDLNIVLTPELFKRDRTRKLFRSLQWATSGEKHPDSIPTIQRALSYWPNGADNLQVYCKKVNKVEDRVFLSWTPLLTAIDAHHLDAVAFLLSKGASVHQAEKAGKHHHPEAGIDDSLLYPLHRAVLPGGYSESQGSQQQSTKLAMIEMLLRYGANPNQLSVEAGRRPGRMMTPLLTAIIDGGADSDVIQLLIRWGAAATREPYSTALHQRWANVSPISHLIDAYQEHTEDHCASLKILATNGGCSSNEEARMHTKTGEPVLLELLSKPKESRFAPRMVQTLLQYTEARVQHRSAIGDVALVHFLRSHLNWSPSFDIPERYVPSNEKNRSMMNAAGVSCEIIDELLRHGANMERAGIADGASPLHIACGLNRNFRQIFEFLLERGASIDSTTSRGHTLLHSLVMGDCHADYTLLEVLIEELKLKRFARDNDGNTFLHLLVTQRLESYGNWMKEAAKYFKRSDFDDPRGRNNAGRTPLEEASFGSDANAEITRFLLGHCYDEK
ncbi:ankyrin repeat-containing domain protein [Pestalotiopsis sp. NC0098]|nr:ankyrin repeat-containing domain protein [Pestalotiopsis sp. NC0098]